jgi:aromatic ring-opening dioxygenase catalytic subunit (LigB family)
MRGRDVREAGDSMGSPGDHDDRDALGTERDHDDRTMRGAKLTRRTLLASTGAAAAGAVIAACTPGGAASRRAGAATPDTDEEEREVTDAIARMPTVYVPHGGGPWPFVDVGFGDAGEWARLADYLRGLAHVAPARPRALLVISAHWEAAVPTVTTSARPPLLFDYSGFPPESYRITWPVPGDPALASRVRALLGAAGIASAEDAERGLDHGTFVPLKLTYPEADVPVVQLSLVRGLDPAAHLAMGRALAPLRDEGVLIVGSGMSFHDMRGFGSPSALPPSEAFDEWLRETVALEPDARDARLARWEDAPSARACHPREEHLIPLMVIAGAAGGDRGTTPYAERLMGVRVSAAHFG